MLAHSKASESAFWYWNRPVSVTMAQNRQLAMSGVMRAPKKSPNSATMTPEAAASGRTRKTSPKGALEGWWSITATWRERSSTVRALLSRGVTERSTTMKRSGSPSYSLARTYESAPGRKR